MGVKLRTRVFKSTKDKNTKEWKLTRVTSKHKMKATGRKTKKGHDEFKPVLDAKGNKILVKIKNPTYQYYLDIYVKGKPRICEYLPIFNYPDSSPEVKESNFLIANQTRNNKEQELSSKNLKDYVPDHKSLVVFVDYARDVYFPTYENKDFRKVSGAINHFEKYLEGVHKVGLTFGEFDVLIANGFLKYLKKKSGLKGETPLAYLKKIKAIIVEAKAENYLKSNPFETVSTKDLRTETTLKKNILTHSELATLYKSTCNNEWVKRAFILACYSGLGMAEIRTLKWSQIDFEQKILTYSRAKTEVEAKVHLHSIVEKVLFGINRNSDLVFDNQLGTDEGVKKVLQTWVRKAGIKKHITFYCGRHTYGTYMQSESKDLLVTAKAMGQKNTIYTEVYAKVLDNADIKAAKSIPDVSEMG
jgi:integrase